MRLLASVFEEALKTRASDIHVEPQEKALRIRFRIDGVLHVKTEADAKIAGAVALRLKLMSGLDIAEKRLPQDGRFHVKLKAGAVDVRISTMPTQYGESVVMRLLNQSGGLPPPRGPPPPPPPGAPLPPAPAPPHRPAPGTPPPRPAATRPLFPSPSRLSSPVRTPLAPSPPPCLWP